MDERSCDIPGAGSSGSDRPAGQGAESSHLYESGSTVEPGAYSEPSDESVSDEGSDLRRLREDFRRLRQDMMAFASAVISGGRESIASAASSVASSTREGVSSAAEHLRDSASAGGEAVREGLHAARDRGRDALSAIHDQIEHRPMASLGIAFLAGLVIGKVLDRSIRD